MKGLKFHDAAAVILVIFGLLAYFLFESKEDALVFFVAYLALVYTISNALRERSEARRINEIRLVSGDTIKDLTDKLSEELIKLDGRTIISIQVINETNAVIVYKY